MVSDVVDEDACTRKLASKPLSPSRISKFLTASAGASHPAYAPDGNASNEYTRYSYRSRLQGPVAYVTSLARAGSSSHANGKWEKENGVRRWFVDRVFKKCRDRCGFTLWECCVSLIKNIQDSMINEEDYVELGMACVDVCTTLSRGLNGKPLKDLSDSVCGAINQLTT